eukprot:8290022-Pyramimonas_sp.AAC.1
MTRILIEDFEDFANIVGFELRAKFIIAPTVGARKQVRKEGNFRCTGTLADGTVCNSAWPSQRMPAEHVARAMRRSRGQLHAGRIFAIANMCALCDR